MSQANPNDFQVNAYSESYVLYGDKTKAFYAAFPDAKCKPNVANNKGSNLFKLGDIQVRIKELRTKLSKQTEEEFNITVSDLKKMLVMAAKGGLVKRIDAQQNTVLNNIAGAVSAISEINRMDGNHYQYKSDEENKGEAQPLVINFGVNPAVKEVKTTNANT